MDLALIVALSFLGDPSATLWATEDVFGVQARVSHLEGAAWVAEAAATASADMGSYTVSFRAGRAWWSDKKSSRASKFSYALGFTLEHDESPITLSFDHYSTGKGLLGEQEEHHNPTTDILSVGYRWSF